MLDLELLEKGGIVVYILLGYSVIGLTVAFIKYIHYLRIGAIPNESQVQSTSNYRGCELAVIRSLNEAVKNNIKNLDDVASRVINKELIRLESGLKFISMLATTAPLLGLLGTVTGMIQAFMVIETSGGKVDASLLAGGIWEAMITTGVGLSVAILLMIVLHHLESIVEKRYNSMTHFASLFFENTNAVHTQSHNS